MPDESRPSIMRLIARRRAAMLGIAVLADHDRWRPGAASHARRRHPGRRCQGKRAGGHQADCRRAAAFRRSGNSRSGRSAASSSRRWWPTSFRSCPTPGCAPTTAHALAQSLQGLNQESMSKGDRALVDSVFWLLRDAGRTTPDWIARGAIARSIGRLPFEGKQAREADVVMVALVRPRHRATSDVCDRGRRC